MSKPVLGVLARPDAPPLAPVGGATSPTPSNPTTDIAANEAAEAADTLSADPHSSPTNQRTVSRQPSALTAKSTSTTTTSTSSEIPSLRWVLTLQKLTAAKAGQARNLAEARRDHRKSNHDGRKDADCTICVDFSTRGSALMTELEAMDSTLRGMEDAVVEEVRDFKSSRRREKRETEREKKRTREVEAGKRRATATSRAH